LIIVAITLVPSGPIKPDSSARIASWAASAPETSPAVAIIRNSVGPSENTV
jgi:hypothetical protein